MGDQLDDDEIAKRKDAIDSVEDSSIEELPFELFEKQGNRTTKLLATSGAASAIEGRRRWHAFKLKEPVLVTRVTVEVSGYSEFSDFEFAWLDERQREKEVVGRPVNGVLIFSVNDICYGFTFRPPTMFFSNPEILTVRVEGVQRGNIGAALDALSDLDAYKQEILDSVDSAISGANQKIDHARKVESERATIQREISQQKLNLNRVKKNIDELTAARSELIAQNAASDTSIADSQIRLRSIQAESSKLSKHNDALLQSISDNENKLKELNENINIFPTEIVSFVDQGSKNLRQYFWLALIPIVIIGAMFVLLVNGAADLTTVITENNNVNIQALMLSRIPYVAIATAIITACYKISRSFIMEMMKINNQRINLTKISIIAKDVSLAAEQGLNFDDEDTYRLRTELKMQMLKDHLKDYISRDFKVELPRHILELLPSPARSSTQNGLQNVDGPTGMTN